MYADKVTGSMQRAIEETNRRRDKQLDHNERHGITPQGVIKRVTDIMRRTHIGEDGMMAYLYGEATNPDDVVVLGVPSDPRIESDVDISRVFMRPYSELGGPVAALFDEYFERRLWAG